MKNDLANGLGELHSQDQPFSKISLSVEQRHVAEHRAWPGQFRSAVARGGWIETIGSSVNGSYSDSGRDP